MSIELKIKAKTLYTEAQLIRIERAKLKARARWLSKRADKILQRRAGDPDGCHLQRSATPIYLQAASLREHDKNIVSRAARNTHLARMFIAGTPLLAAEGLNRPDRAGPDWDAIARMVAKYAPHMGNQLAAWREAAGRGPKAS